MEKTNKIDFKEILEKVKTWFKNLNYKKILTIAGNVLIWLFVAFSLVITILVFSAQGSEDGVPSVFGKSLITISTDSMSPVYEAGDLVFMEKLDSEAVAGLKKGDIITFRTPVDINGDGMVGDLNTHRIEEVQDANNRFVTKGDHNLIPDNEGDTPYYVHHSDVIGICTEDGKIKGLGNVISFLRSSLGFFLCIVLPLILFFLYELYNFITIIVTERAKRATVSGESEEEIKRRAVEEYIKQQQNEEEIKKRAIEEYLAKQAAASEEKTEANNEEK